VVSVRRRRLLPLLAIVACSVFWAVPATAWAVEFPVNSTADEVDDNVGNGVCHTAGGNCTLRAAVEESNATEAKDLVTFAANFNGEPADTIALGSPLPITKPIAIVGGTCEPLENIDGPCAGVSGPSGNFGIQVDNADESLISGLAVTGALTGIDVIDSSQEFKAVRNWLGVKLDGTAGADNTGLFLDPDSDRATIGEPGEGNVISGNNNEGLDLEGASEATIEGNYFGVAPDGSTQVANGKDIEITDSTAAPGFKATGDVIGGELTTGEATSAACDGPCNVISGAASFGIDLKGNGALQNEAPAGGKTQIVGNLIGLNAPGTGVVANFRVGILVGEADGVQIGGPSAEFANRINGGEAGIQAGPSAQDLSVEGNGIGLDAAGTGSELTPTTEGIAVKAEGTTAGHAATIAGNRIAMAGGIAIEVEGNGATATTIAENVIGRGVGGEQLTAGAFGIRVDGPPGTGSLIEGNVVERAHLIGMLIESSNNSVVANEVIGAETASGIVIQKFAGSQEASGNTIGGDAAEAGNEISGSGENAIEIADSIDTDNRILRNTGSGNAGLFIDLGGDGLGNQPSGPNDGIQAPTIASATPTGVSGAGALAGAEVLIFEKATPQNGEIKAFLGETEAETSGNWELKYETPLPEGIEVGVTQTGLEGTSELAQAKSATPPPPPPGDGGGGAGGGGAGGKEKGNKNKGKAKGKGKDRTPPQTTITKGPPRRTHKRAAKFKFTSSEAGSTFQCKLDRRPFKPCRSPKKYKGLKPGKHVFKVRATDAAGNTDPTPAVRKFTVLK
jgi:CSLREA domain-containing protein